MTLNASPVRLRGGAGTGLNVQIGDVEGVGVDEVAAGFDEVAHQFGEQQIGFVDGLDLDLEQSAHVGIERGFPQLAGVHLAQALVALQRDALAARAGDGGEQRRGAMNVAS